MVDLLRGLVGRMPDDHVTGLRIELAENGPAEAEWAVLWRLREHGLRLTDAEVALLPLIEVDRDDFPVEPPGVARPEHRFEPAAPSGDDEVLLGRAESPGLRRVVKARRVPIGDAPAKVVYVAEYGPGVDLVALQSLLSQRLGGALAEVVVAGEDLPPYQAAALAAGTPIWPR